MDHSSPTQIANLARFIAFCLGQKADAQVVQKRESFPTLRAMMFSSSESVLHKPEDVFVYHDGVIAIVSSATSLALQLKRLSNKNPVLMMRGNGEVYRVHGESRYILNHMIAVARSTVLQERSTDGGVIEYTAKPNHLSQGLEPFGD